MAPCHRLGGLQMGEARHHPVRPRLGLSQQRADQRPAALHRGIALIAHPQAEIGRHLVVAAARGVQAAGGLADQFLQARFHVHVDVLEVGAEGKVAALDL